MEEISGTNLLVFFQQIKKGIFGRIKWKRNKASPSWVANTDPERNSRIHWWSFLDTDEKGTLFLFGSHGLLNYIVNNNLDVFKRVIPGQIK